MQSAYLRCLPEQHELRDEIGSIVLNVRVHSRMRIVIAVTENARVGKSSR